MSTIRCKFRCLTLTHQADQGVLVGLRPVYGKSPSSPEGADENLRFWKATPTGEVTLHYQLDATVPFTVGSYYYIDITLSEGTEGWKLWELSQHETNLGIRMGLAWVNGRPLMSGEMSMTIDNQDAWAPFLGRVGAHWQVVFTPA